MIAPGSRDCKSSDPARGRTAAPPGRARRRPRAGPGAPRGRPPPPARVPSL